jgi:hypothetical protein
VEGATAFAMHGVWRYGLVGGIMDDLGGLDGRVAAHVFDDAGKQQGSSYDAVSIEELLRSRYDAGLPTILTTNHTRNDWSDKYGKAMGSFVYEAFRPVTLEGEDLRSGA